MIIISYLFAVLKNIIYGVTPFFTGNLTESTSVMDVLALRFLVSFVVMWLLKTVKIIKVDVKIGDVFKKDRPRHPYMLALLMTGIFEPVLYMFFETMGISMSTNVTTGVILSLSPITSVIFESLILKERSTLLQKVFLGVGIVGVIYIAAMTNTADGKDSVLGILCLLMAVISGSLFVTFSRKSSKHFNAMEVTYVSAMLGTVAFNAVNIVRHIINGTLLHYFDPFFNLENLIGFFVLGVVSTIVATGMNNFALGYMQISTMAAFGGLSTLVIIAVGVIFNHEPLYYFHWIGLALIVTRMVGVSVIAIRRTKTEMQTKQCADAEGTPVPATTEITQSNADTND